MGEGTSFAGALGAAEVAGLAAAEAPGAADALAAGEAADPDALAAREGAPFLVHTRRPKRAALWKFPWPKIGDHETPPLFFMA